MEESPTTLKQAIRMNTTRDLPVYIWVSTYTAKPLEPQSMTGHAISITSKDPASQEKSMQRKILRAVALRTFALVVVLGATWLAQAQDPKTP
jgi:hypothetical protein